MTYNNLALALISESNNSNSILDIDKELDNFNKILESIDILNENNILLEEDKVKTTLKERLIKIWDKIKKFFEEIIDKIYGFITGMKNNKKEYNNKFILISDYKPVGARRLNEYLFEATSKLNEYLLKINNFLTNIEPMLVNIGNTDNMEEKSNDIIKEIDDMTNNIKNDMHNIKEKYEGMWYDNPNVIISAGTDVSSIINKLFDAENDLYKKSQNTNGIIEKYKNNIAKNLKNENENTKYLFKINSKIIELLTEIGRQCSSISFDCDILAGELKKVSVKQK